MIRYTKEVYVPNPSNSEAVDLVTRLPEGAVLYKTFVTWFLPSLRHLQTGSYALTSWLRPLEAGDRRGWYQTRHQELE